MGTWNQENGPIASEYKIVEIGNLISFLVPID